MRVWAITGNDTPLNSAYRLYADQPLTKPDIAQAKQLLAEAGHPTGLQATLIASDTPAVRTQLAVAVREMAKPAGFTIDVQTMPHATNPTAFSASGSISPKLSPASVQSETEPAPSRYAVPHHFNAGIRSCLLKNSSITPSIAASMVEIR